MEDPIKQPPLETETTRPLRGTRDLFDINILPARYRPKRLTLIGLLPWLLLIVLLGTIYPTYTLAVQSQGNFQDSRLALAKVQADLDFYQNNSQEEEALQSQIDDAETQREAILLSFGGLQFSTVKWSPILSEIHLQLPAGVSWVQIAQQDQKIRLDGVATEYQLVINLRDTLQTINSLGTVAIDSIERVETEDIPDPSSVEDEGITADEEPFTAYRFTILTNLAGEVGP
jgi:Tfp pilus assembly protein PilN